MNFKYDFFFEKVYLVIYLKKVLGLHSKRFDFGERLTMCCTFGLNMDEKVFWDYLLKISGLGNFSKGSWKFQETYSVFFENEK